MELALTISVLKIVPHADIENFLQIRKVTRPKKILKKLTRSNVPHNGSPQSIHTIFSKTRPYSIRLKTKTEFSI